MDSSQYLQLGLALILVLGLMGLFSFVLKKINHMQSGLGSRNNRVTIVEQRMIDAKSKVILVRCDQKEHLILMAQSGNVVLETGIKAPKEIGKPVKADVGKHDTFD